MKRNKEEIKKIAENIIDFENNQQYDDMQNYISSLDLELEDMLQIDKYITEKFLTN